MYYFELLWGLDWLDRYLPPRNKSLETIASVGGGGGVANIINMSELGSVGLLPRLMKEMDENDIYTIHVFFVQHHEQQPPVQTHLIHAFVHSTRFD